jgi:hypothetical protein
VSIESGFRFGCGFLLFLLVLLGGLTAAAFLLLV